jgi:hypothetical protein
VGFAFVAVQEVVLAPAIESMPPLAVHTWEYYTVDNALELVVEVAVDNLETEVGDYIEDVLIGVGIDMAEVVDEEGIVVVEVGYTTGVAVHLEVRDVDRRKGWKDLVRRVRDIGPGLASDKGHKALEIVSILSLVAVENLFFLVECY